MTHLLMLFLGISSTVTPELPDPCDHPREALTIEKQIDIGIGCSSIKGRRVHREEVIWGVINEEK